MRRSREVAAVEHEIAADRGEPGRAQRGDQRLKLLDGDLRISVSLEHEIALEGRAGQRPVGVRLGLPAVIGAEHFEVELRSPRGRHEQLVLQIGGRWIPCLAAR